MPRLRILDFGFWILDRQSVGIPPRRLTVHYPPCISRRGITLIELLVAMTILLMITAITLPVIAPNLATRRIREAARDVDVYLGVARNRAIELGRPVGVMLAPMSIGSQSLPATSTLFQVEVPPPYGGQSINSTATVQQTSTTSPPTTATTWNMKPGVTGDYFDTTQVHVNDRVRLNHEGPFYVVNAVTASLATLSLSAQTFTSGYQPPWPLSSAGSTSLPAVPFEVFPHPIRSSVPPLQLPSGAIVDLQYSGIDVPPGTTSTTMNNWPYWFATMAAINNGNAVGVMIVFLPTGAVEGMYYPTQAQGASLTSLLGLNAPYPFRPTSLIYLNVGKWERLDRTVGNKPNTAPNTASTNQWANDGLYNWQDPDCLWVTINPQNGYVTTKENAALSHSFLTSGNAWFGTLNLYITPSGGLTSTNNGTTYLSVNGANASRWVARQAQQVSGR